MTQAEFIPLAERYKDTVYRIALNYYGSPYDADDTVQDVMLKLFQHKEPFESEEHVRYWLCHFVSHALFVEGLHQEYT